MLFMDGLTFFTLTTRRHDWCLQPMYESIVVLSTVLVVLPLHWYRGIPPVYVSYIVLYRELVSCATGVLRAVLHYHTIHCMNAVQCTPYITVLGPGTPREDSCLVQVYRTVCIPYSRLNIRPLPSNIYEKLLVAVTPLRQNTTRAGKFVTVIARACL
jgi:hypothetical protein